MDMQEMNSMVARAMAGDKQAFADLCREKGRSVLYLCTRSMGNLQDGEDAAQEVFVRMQKNIVRLKNPEAFTVWMQRIVHNTCSSHKKARLKGSYDLSAEELQDMLIENKIEYIPQSYIEEDGKRKMLLDIIDNLPDKDRTCILLFYYEELTLAEIAQVMDTSEGSVGVRLHRAKAKIRSRIEKIDSSNADTPMISMNALTALFARDAGTLITDEAVNACVQQIVAGGAAVAGKLLIKKIVAGAAAATGVVLVCAAIYNASLPPVETGFVSDPQHSQAARYPSGVLEDTEPVTDTVIPETSLPAQGAYVPGEGKPGEEQEIKYEDGTTSLPKMKDEKYEPDINKPGKDKPDGAKQTLVSGRVVFLDKEGQAATLEGVDLTGYTAVLKREDGASVATTQLRADGSYLFETLYLEAGGSFFVEWNAPHTRAPHIETDSGKLASVRLVAGKSANVETLYVTDTEAPSVELELLGADGQQTGLRPVLAKIYVGDMAPAGCSWRILDEEGKVVRQGSGESVQIPKLAEGRYTFEVVAADISGNETSSSANFIYL